MNTRVVKDMKNPSINFHPTEKMRSVSVWVVDSEYGTFKLCHTNAPEYDMRSHELDSERYLSAWRNSYYARLKRDVSESLRQLRMMGRFRGKKSVRLSFVAEDTKVPAWLW